MKKCCRIQTVALCAIAALLAGCSVLSAKPAAELTRYSLDDASIRATRTAGELTLAALHSQGTKVLIVNRPSAASGFDSPGMIYLRQAQQLESFANNAWVDTPARMLAPLLVRALQADGFYRAVLSSPSAASADLRLDTSIVRLQQDFRQTPSQVRFTMQATLVDSTTRQVIVSRELDAVRTADSDDPMGGALAAKLAVQDVLEQLAAVCSKAASTWTPKSAGT